MGAFKNCWSDGAKRSDLEREEVIIREWMLGINILVMVQLFWGCLLSLTCLICMQSTSYEMLGLRVPWTARRSKQSILKEISPEYLFGRTDAEAPTLWPSDVKN